MPTPPRAIKRSQFPLLHCRASPFSPLVVPTAAPTISPARVPAIPDTGGPMKLKINKACDLSSISVLPPHARNPCSMTLGGDGLGSGRSQAAAQLRSQSQQSLSQGLSFSQLSQNSLDESLFNDQRFGSQERDNPSKRSTSLAPTATARDESQMQLSRTSNNALQRWKLASAPENRSQFGEEIERRIRQMEGLLSRLGMTMDTVQCDVMQVNRAVKEVSLETEGIRQKMFLLENSMQQLLKAEENIKTFLDGSLKSFSDKMIKEPDCSKLNEISAAVSVLPKQIEATLLKLQHEVCMAFTREMEVIASGMQSSKNKYPARIQSPETGSYVYTRRPKNNQMLPDEILIPPVRDHTRKRTEAETQKALKPKLTASKHNMIPKKEEIQLIPRDQGFRIIISDEESDADVSCLLVKKETGRASFLREEAEEETLRILRKARKRKRRQSNFVVLS